MSSIMIVVLQKFIEILRAKLPRNLRRKVKITALSFLKLLFKIPKTIPKFMQTVIASYNFNGNIQTRLFKHPCDKVGELKLPYS